MDEREESNLEHDRSEGWSYDSVAHRSDEEHEEGERVAPGVEDGDEEEERVRDARVADRVEVVVVLVDGEHFENEEDDRGRNVVLDGKKLAPVEEA